MANQASIFSSLSKDECSRIESDFDPETTFRQFGPILGSVVTFFFGGHVSLSFLRFRIWFGQRVGASWHTYLLRFRFIVFIVRFLSPRQKNKYGGFEKKAILFSGYSNY